ncbi:hypothetical protein EDD15DRAFT_2448942 [Pisolithus albus]|nr:hypothetical protein EDD15DRAFT_2448942 [Pisolithus albus]
MASVVADDVSQSFSQSFPSIQQSTSPHHDGSNYQVFSQGLTTGQEAARPDVPKELVKSELLTTEISLVEILISYWIAYGTSRIGGTRCAPLAGVPYTGPLLSGSPTFDPYTNVPAEGGLVESSQLFPALLLGLGMAFMPYSPRWLTERGHDDEALLSLSTLRRKPLDDPTVRYEFLEIKAELRYSREITSLKYPNASKFRRVPKFKRLAIGCLTVFYQQFIGINAIVYCVPTTWTYPNTTSLPATGLYGILNTLGTIPAIVPLDSVGRRPLLMSGALGCCSALLIFGSLVAAFSNDGPGHPSAGRAAIAFVYFYGVNLTYSWAPIGWVLTSEVFPLYLRSTGISITTSCTWMSNFIIGLVSPRMLANIAHGGTCFFFAAFAILAFIPTYFYPETKGKTLEEMDMAFGDVTSEQEEQHMERIRGEPGLLSKALLSACHRAMDHTRVACYGRRSQISY